MEEKKQSKIENLIGDVEEYLQTQKQINTLVIAEKTSRVSSALASLLIVILLFFFTIVFASVALAFIISNHFASHSIGFGIVALMYFLLAIILFAGRKKFIETPMMNAMIKKYFQSEDDEKN